jgi:CRISPR-associated endoribonuclease Cas6
LLRSLRSFVLNMTAILPGTLDAAAGELVHAAFYAAIDAVDPALAKRMHDAQTRALFTLSPLHGYRRDAQSMQVRVAEGQSGWLRVTLLDDELAGAFFRTIQRQPLPILRLGDIILGVTDALGAPGSHPWSGYSTIDELASVDHAPNAWVLEYASPTVIRWGEADNKARRIEPFPLPRMAVAGLRTRWDRLAGATWGRAFEEWVERNVIVGRIWNWRTESFRFQGQTYYGGLGKLEYRLLDPSNRANAIHFERLLRLAFFTGIGYKTTHGLGQVRLLSGDEP